MRFVLEAGATAGSRLSPSPKDRCFPHTTRREGRSRKAGLETSAPIVGANRPGWHLQNASATDHQRRYRDIVEGENGLIMG